MTVEIRVADQDDALASYVAVVARVAPRAAQTVEELRAIERDVALVHLVAFDGDVPVGAGFCVEEPRLRRWKGAFARTIVVEELELPFPPHERASAACRWERSPFGTFDACPLCGGDLAPEHAHFRCASCGWRDSCCD